MTRERTPGYETLVAATGIDPTQRRVAYVGLKSQENNERWAVRMGHPTETPHGKVIMRGVSDIGVPDLDLPPELDLFGYGHESVVQHELAEAPKSAEEYLSRVQQAKARLAAADFAGGATTANGWVPILEAVINAIALIAPHSGRLFHKEKFGGLRVSIELWQGVSADLTDYFDDLEQWAEYESDRRCMAYGTPGRKVTIQGYVHTLSEEAAALDPMKLWEIIYPQRAQSSQATVSHLRLVKK